MIDVSDRAFEQRGSDIEASTLAAVPDCWCDARWWRHRDGSIRCEECSPPGMPTAVAEWIEGPQRVQLLDATRARLQRELGTGEEAALEVACDLIGYPFTDLGNARRFVAMHRGRFLYAREERIWLEWRDGRWRRDVTGAAERAAKAVVEELWEQVAQLDDEERKKAAQWAITSQNAGKLRAMLELAATELDFVVRLEQLDSDPWLLSCGNGTLDLRTGELRAPTPPT